MTKMRIEQSVGSYQTSRRTVTADISPISDEFSGSVVVWPAVDIAVDTDRFRSHRSFRTFELIVVKCPCNSISMKRHYNLFINEMIGLYLVPRLRTSTID